VRIVLKNKFLGHFVNKMNRNAKGEEMVCFGRHCFFVDLLARHKEVKPLVAQ